MQSKKHAVMMTIIGKHGQLLLIGTSPGQLDTTRIGTQLLGHLGWMDTTMMDVIMRTKFMMPTMPSWVPAHV